MKSLILEKTDRLGGISSQVGGTGAFCFVNRWQKAAGIQDSREKALGYLRHVGGGYAMEGHMEAYVDNAARVIEYISDKEGIEFTGAKSSGFYDAAVPQAAAKGRRITISKPFHAPALGAWRDKVRQFPYLRGFLEALSGRGISSEEAYGPFRTSERELAAWKKRLGPAKFEALLQENEEYREGGAGWMAYLLNALVKRGGEVRTEAEVERLLVENGRVVGVVVNQKGKVENIRADKGVLLALGNKMLGMEADWGDGWRLAAEAGAKINNESQIVTALTIRVPDELFPNGKPIGRRGPERYMPHSLIVNRFGERFANEAWYSLASVANNFDDWPEHHFRNFPNYLIFDRQLLEKYAFVGMPPGHLDEGDLEWLAQGKTLSELAQKLEISKTKLETTVARFNKFAQIGKDSDFSRDPKTLGVLEKPPFYGVPTGTPDPFAGLLTVATNPGAQVLHYKTGKPIPGFYCCGALGTTARYFGVGYQGGLQMGGGATFGFLAAEHAAATHS